MVGQVEAPLHRQPVAVAARVGLGHAGAGGVHALLVGHRHLHVCPRRGVGAAREGHLEQVVDGLDAEVGDEQPAAARAARVGLRHPAAVDVDHDRVGVGIGRAEGDGVGGPVQQGQAAAGVVRCDRVVGRQPCAADPHPHGQRTVGGDVVEVHPHVRDAVRPADVPDPRRLGVDEVALSSADHVRRRELRQDGEHRVRAQGDRRARSRLHLDRVLDRAARGHPADRRLDVAVAALTPRQGQPVGRDGERARPGDGGAVAKGELCCETVVQHGEVVERHDGCGRAPDRAMHRDGIRHRCA